MIDPVQRRILLAGLFAINAVMLISLARWNAWSSPDWQVFATVPVSHPYDPLVVAGDVPSMWRYSPVALWAMQPLAIVAGQWGWAALHVAVLGLLPRRVALVFLISFPFWADTIFGNVFVLVAVAAYWAVRGNRLGVVAFAVLTLLMPRPLQVPLLLWLLYREPWFQIPFGWIFVGHALLVLASGHASEWLSQLVAPSSDLTSFANASPSRWFGYAWLIVGIPLGVELLRRGRPAWAGLAMSPYLLPQYWMMALVDVPDDAPEPGPAREREGRQPRRFRTVRRWLGSPYGIGCDDPRPGGPGARPPSRPGPLAVMKTIRLAPRISRTLTRRT